jgi:hypothetical protein
MCIESSLKGLSFPQLDMPDCSYRWALLPLPHTFNIVILPRATLPASTSKPG